jgi:glycosyltransferase involved in cell wall biosynthesis
MMKVLLLNNSDIDGGAARAAYRLYQGLQRNKVDTQMLVQVKCSDNPGVIGPPVSSGIGQVKTGLRLVLDKLPLKLYPLHGKATYSPQWLPDRTVSQVKKIRPDLVNLHWVNNGYVNIDSIARFNQPIVWTLHDMWAFTGGCHYDQGCSRYINSCGKCPQLGSNRNLDLSRWIWNRKAKVWKKINLTVVTPSQWLADCAKKSYLFKDYRIECIPNGLDTNVYRPIDRRMAREILQLPQDKYLILSGSLGANSDKRKGFHLLQPALQKLSQAGWSDGLELIVFGMSQPDNPPEFGLKTRYLGTLGDDYSLALLYSAVDAFIAPSLQDNLPNTIMEALSCGTPCVAFNIGGMPDMIEHQGNGYLASPYQIDDLARGISWVLEDQERHDKLSYCAREKVLKQFTLNHQANRYSSLFSEILKSSEQTEMRSF